MGIPQEQHEENTPTDPDSTLPRVGGGASPASSPGASSCASCSRKRSAVKVVHFTGIMGFLAYLTPWAMRRYDAEDNLPMGAIGACIVLLITRANIFDVAKAIGTLTPWGKK